MPALRSSPWSAFRITRESPAAVTLVLRTLLVLRDGQGLDYADIAKVLGVPVGTVKSRLFRARAALRERVEGLEGDAP